MNNSLLSTGKDDWETPGKLFKELDEEFHFTLDPCCTHESAKCKKHHTPEEDGLSQDWTGETVFCNPPYSKKGRQDEWVRKCFEEGQKPGTTVVMLIPARTDTERFHKYIWGKSEIRFLKGRIFFEINGKPLLDKNGKPQPAPFPSMVVIFRGDENDRT